MSEKNQLTVGELVYKISGDMDNLKTQLKKSEAEVKKLSKSMQKGKKRSKEYADGFKTMKNAVKAFIAGALVRGIAMLAKSGAELDSLTGSFNRLAGDLGVNADETLQQLRKLSAGTISDKDLILGANRAMVLGVAKNTEEFGQLMQIARLRARDMGLTTTQAFNDIVTGIGRGSPLILDNLGIVIKQNEAYEIYAKQLNKTTEALTANEKREALKFAVLKQGQEQLEQAGELTLTYAERLQQVTTATENLKQRTGQALLPTIESLLQQMGFTALATKDTTAEFEAFSKALYQTTNFIIGTLKIMKLLVQGFTALGDVIVGSVIDSLKGVTGAVGKLVEGDFKGAMREMSKAGERGGQNVVDKTKAWVSVLDDTLQSIGDSAEAAMSAKGFKPVTMASGETGRAVASDMQEMATSVEEGSEDAQKALEEFEGKMLELIDQSKEVKKALEEDLSGAFTKFADNLKDNVKDTITSLAQLVVGAEEEASDLNDQIEKERKDLSKKLAAIDGKDAGRRQAEARAESEERVKELKKQLAVQEEILAARAGFEERQAQRIADLRTKLEDAGIDPDRAGIDQLLSVQSLEEQIAEERRLAALDEFTRFEEEQTKKLEILATNMITEVNILKEKIATQEQYESDLTEFLLSEDDARLASTDAWASATIQKYGEVADSLRTLISLQARAGQLRSLNTVSTPSASIPDTGGGSVTTTNNTKNVSAPVTINATMKDSLDMNALSREMGFELSRL